MCLEDKADVIAQAFEFLRDCVPTVSRANWKSNIRKFVSVHEDYSDMASYEGPETADIVYKDFDGAMTQYFIDKEFLDEEIWEDETPKYFFEVKTTTQASKTRFFMSNAQKKRVSDSSVSAITRPSMRRRW